MKLFELFATLSLDTKDFVRNVNEATKKGASFASTISQKVSAGTIALGNLMARGAEVLSRKLWDFGGDIVQIAAEIEAEKQQFQAAFGDMSDAASAAMKSIGKDTGIMSARLRTVGTKAFVQFKGAGLDAAASLATMDRYTRLAADAAAQYNISLEDADSRIRSFLRGNVEAGDAIGLFTSENQRNTYALEKYSQKWLELTEAQKQMLMLDVAEDIYKQSGAIGQAERKSSSWAVALGNLQEGWRQAKGTLGNALMKSLIPAMEKLSEYLNKPETQERLAQFGETLGQLAGLALDGLEGFFQWLVDNKQVLVDGWNGITSFFSDLWAGIRSLMGGDTGALTTLAAALAAVWAAMNPGAFTVVAIIGGIALIISKWEDLKQWVSDATTAVTEFFSVTVPAWWNANVIEPIIAGWSSVTGQIQAAIDAAKTFFSMGSAGGDLYDESGNVRSGVYMTSEMAKYVTGGPDIPVKGYATGLPNVPYDNFPAFLHQGEAVLTKSQANDWRRGDQERINVRELAQEIAREMADALRGVTVNMDGQAVGHLVSPTVNRDIAAAAWAGRYRG